MENCWISRARDVDQLCCPGDRIFFSVFVLLFHQVKYKSNLFLGETEFLVKCMLKCAEDEFDPEANTNGRINLGTAVNALVEDLIEDRLNKV